jgi:hypothetical protein
MACEQSVSNAPLFQALFAAPHQARGGRTEHVTNRIVHENIYSAELLLREPYALEHRLIDTHIDMVEMRVSACVSNERCCLFPRTGVNVGHHNLCVESRLRCSSTACSSTAQARARRSEACLRTSLGKNSGDCTANPEARARNDRHPGPQRRHYVTVLKEQTPASSHGGRSSCCSRVPPCEPSRR